jgi:hypothetical protein
MIYLLAAIGLTPGGSSTVHIYTQIIQRQHNRHKQYIEQNNDDDNDDDDDDDDDDDEHFESTKQMT